MNDKKPIRSACCVHPCSRPSGAPFGMDAASPSCQPSEARTERVIEHPFQTPEHNLIPGKSGPKVGVHFILQISANRAQSRILAILRETLLPKLLSGELNFKGDH